MNQAELKTHKVWRVGANVDTDALAPGAYMKHGIDVIAAHCLEVHRTDFSKQVKPGDVLVAGPNFGIGSSREQAAGALKHLGIAAVIAPSYSGLFFRNAFNLGLLLLTCPEADLLHENEQVQMTYEGTRPQVLTAEGSVLACESVPSFLMDMVNAGGLVNVLKQRMTLKRSEDSQAKPTRQDNLSV
jgi:3-isopropylmalate/(R)-2-methylmalate dehydratase small subunit